MIISELGHSATKCVNKAFGAREPWQIATITATTVLSVVWLWGILTDNEGITSKLRKNFFKYMRKIPMVKKKVEAELQKIENDFIKEALKGVQGMPYITKLPRNALSNSDIQLKVDDYLKLGHYKWQEGKVSGAVYYYQPELVKLVTDVYGKASYTNPLHADVFPGICKMEAEVIRMVANIFNGGPNTCGTMTTGGTESIMMACKAYRDFACETKGITNPNIVAPVTAHPAFDKSCQYFKIFLKSVKVNSETTEVDIKAMEKSIDMNTILLVGSAPNFPYGTMDDIEQIARLGMKHNIPVHVDACLGSFVVAFMSQAGYNVKPFDFRIPGVTSLSADTHKYGFTPKGSSVILYVDKKFVHHQYTVTTDWPGGVYGSPTVNGSRAGGIIAATWATMLSFGQEGYIEATKSIVDTSRYIENALRQIKGIFIYGKPATTVIALGSKHFDIFRLSDLLSKSGWSLNMLQFPSGIHICVTYMHTLNNTADKFIEDVRTHVAELMKNPEAPLEGKMAIYGVAQSVPDRSIVSDFTRLYIDSAYYTPVDS